MITLAFISLISVACYKQETNQQIEQLNRGKDTKFDQGNKTHYLNFSKENIKDLVKLSRVWGVVKYYHPESISVQINRNRELFHVILLFQKKNQTLTLSYINW